MSGIASEMYGDVLERPQTETTPFNPQSPYACAKVYSHYIVKNYRDGYGLFACNGILFNHESPRRGANFVTMKIVNGVNESLRNNEFVLKLGNLNSMRDWGHSKDYVHGMWLMLQQDNPDDYVLATGTTITVRAFVEMSFKHIGVEFEWQGSGVDEKGIDKATGEVVVEIDPSYFRPTEVELLVGDASKAKKELGWVPKRTVEELCSEMVQADLDRFALGLFGTVSGFSFGSAVLLLPHSAHDGGGF